MFGFRKKAQNPGRAAIERVLATVGRNVDGSSDDLTFAVEATTELMRAVIERSNRRDPASYSRNDRHTAFLVIAALCIKVEELTKVSWQPTSTLVTGTIFAETGQNWFIDYA